MLTLKHPEQEDTDTAPGIQQVVIIMDNIYTALNQTKPTEENHLGKVRKISNLPETESFLLRTQRQNWILVNFYEKLFKA